MLLLVLALLAPASERTVVSEKHQVRIDAPAGWTIARQNAYPSVVALMTHEGGGRITLSAQRARSGETAQQLAERNRAALEREGMKVGKLERAPGSEEVWQLEATATDGKLAVRQLYFIRGIWGFSLTLSAPPQKITQLVRDLDVAWHSIRS